jgi:hypothetical protein
MNSSIDASISLSHRQAAGLVILQTIQPSIPSPTMKYSAPIACALLASSAAAFAPATSQVGLSFVL